MTRRNVEAQRATQRKLLAWYAAARRDLPWRRTRDPYAIWVSEVMLQQTRVETAIGYYERFLSVFPSVDALAEAPLADVLVAWSGLGYYRRARMLHAAAQEVQRARGGRFPTTSAELRSLPGVGRYTAGAVASIAWAEPVPVVDGNVARVLSRLYAVDADLRSGAGARRLWDLAGSLVVAEDPSSWNQALMELGATVCVPDKPRCAECPVADACVGRQRGLLAGLPPPRSRKAPLRVSSIGFVVRRQGATLLARRVPAGLFGGMWEPPHLVVGEGGDAELVRLAGPRARRVGVVVHVLSHRRVEVAVYVAPRGRALMERLHASPEYESFAWVSAVELPRYALTRLARKLIERAGEVAPGARDRFAQGG